MIIGGWIDLHQCFYMAATMMTVPEKPGEKSMSFPSLEAMGEPPRCFYDASLLFRRMALNQVDQVELAESDPLLFCELQGLCTLCRSKEQCVVDLANQASDGGSGRWREYCPNAEALDALGVEQNCGLATQHGARHERIIVTKLGSVILRKAKNVNRKVYLERRSGEPAFGPRQYFYAASKGGVLPQGLGC
jgi:hypothetical protein